MSNYIKIIAALVIMLFALGSKAQNKFTVSGTIKDKKTGEVLIGATVKVADKPALGTATNEYGFYSLTLPNGPYKLLVDYVGYKGTTGVAG